MPHTDITSSRPTASIAHFLGHLEFTALPGEVVDHVKLCVLDAIGCVIYGQRLPWSRALRRFVQDEESSATATLWGTTQRTAPGLAGLVNGTAGHGFEIDDLLMSGLFHPGSVTVPTAMAVAEKLGGLSGQAFITSVVSGYEVGARVGAALGQPHFARGFHPQGTVGTLAAAATATVAHGGNADIAGDALGIAASLGSGLMGAQSGGMTKRLHAGRACQNGIHAAAMAAQGFTGTPDVLEMEFGGLLSTLGGTSHDSTELANGLGTEWRTLETGFKAYAACAPIHTSIDAALSLRAEFGIGPEDIVAGTIHTTSHTQLHCGWAYQPSDTTNAQMNLTYCVARALMDGDVFVDQFDISAIFDPSAVALANRFEVNPRADFDALGTSKRHISELELQLIDGRRISRLVEQRTGSLQWPLDRTAIDAKFEKLTRGTFEDRRIDRLRSLIDGLEKLADTTELSEALTGR